jgi:unsaturated rhamnogalacturonyl hydrolase
MILRLPPWAAALASALLAAVPPPARSQGLAAAAPDEAGWGQAARILARIRAPEFPAAVFPITAYGAVPGQDATAAIRAAIAACSAQGGGHVVVPAGTFPTGAIRLLSRVDLHLAAGAVLRFSADPAAYLPAVFTRWEGVECMNYSPLIYAFEQEDIAVTGTGLLDGSAAPDNWWEWARHDQGHVARAAADSRALNAMAAAGVPPEQRRFGAGHYLRPNFIQPYRCRNVLIEGVAIVRSPMWEIHPVLCQNVTVRGVRISSLGPNNDGCDPESCRDVLIEGCVFNTGDDCISIKSGRNADGRRLGVAAENLVIRSCDMRDGHAGVAIGSEISGSCRHVYIEDCRMSSPNLERALRLKSNATRGGTIEDIYARRLAIGRVAEAVLTVDLLYEEGARGSFPPVVRNVSIETTTVESTPRLFFIAGFAGATIDRIRVAHSTIAGLNAAERIEHAGRIELDHVELIPEHTGPSRSSRVLP